MSPLWTGLFAAVAMSAPQVPPAAAHRGGDTVTVTPPRSYRAGPLRRLVLGDGHRDLWSTPMPAMALDLDHFAGGLDALRRGGGQQTRSLRLRGADGVEYSFRSLDKDARATLDPLLRETLAASVLQDRVSALFPLGALVVDRLLEAADVLHVQPRLVVLPDHPRLGEFRADFAGLIGWLEMRPDEGDEEGPGFEGSTRVVSSPRMLERIEEEAGDRVDAAGFLRARLLDVLVGDWDRHPDQWRWAGFPDGGGTVFRPVPRDRDWALSHLDGLMAAVTWVSWPHFVGFGSEYPSVFRLTWSARALDRRLLPGLSWTEWEAVAADLEARLGDPVLREAVGRLPATHAALVGDDLFAALRARRDRLDEVARAYYELLAREVDVTATDLGEVAELAWQSPTTISVVVGPADGPPTFRRTFTAGETREIRLDLRGGDDRARVSGAGAGIIVRVIGGGGADELIDASTGGVVRFYDEGGGTRFVTAAGTGVDTRDWDAPMDLSSNTHQSTARDWGSRWIPIPNVGFEPDVGLFVGAGAQYTGYGFRHFPYRTRLRAGAALGTATGKPRAELAWDFPLVRERLRGDVALAYEGAEVPRFHGFGNETEADRPAAFYEAPQTSFAAAAGLRLLRHRGLGVRVGPSLLVVRPERGATLADSLSPYGRSDFARLALDAGVTWAAQDDPIHPRLSGALAVAGRLTPALLDVEERYWAVSFEASARAVLGGPLRPVVALRAGGERLAGLYPLFDAATVGGKSTLRGYRSRRFTGDASLWAGAETRLFLTEFVFLLPGDLGVLGVADAGRVFLDGETSSTWHAAWGGGVWASFIDSFGLSATWARGSEGTAFYFGAGVPF